MSQLRSRYARQFYACFSCESDAGALARQSQYLFLICPSWWALRLSHLWSLKLLTSHPQDPEAQLEQLRRNSLIGPGDLKLPPKKPIPERAMPSTSAPVPDETAKDPQDTTDKDSGALLDATEKNAAKVAPTFNEPMFGAPSLTGEKESVLSPTAQPREGTVS